MPSIRPASTSSTASSRATSAAFWDAIEHLILPAIALGVDPAGDHRAHHASLGTGRPQRGLRPHCGGQGPATPHDQPVGMCCATRCCPVVTTIGLQAGLLLSGAILTETVFAIPGIGTFLANAIETRDYSAIQGSILIIAVIYVVREPAGRRLVRADRPEGAGDAEIRSKSPRSSPRPPRSTRNGGSIGREAWRRLRRDPAALIGAALIALLRPRRDVRAVDRALRPTEFVEGTVTPPRRPRARPLSTGSGSTSSVATSVSRVIYRCPTVAAVGVVSLSRYVGGLTLGTACRSLRRLDDARDHAALSTSCLPSPDCWSSRSASPPCWGRACCRS